MYLLPSEQKARAEEAIRQFREAGEVVICEPCDCGSHIRHNNGGNYHATIELKRDGEQVFVRYDTTCELTPPAEWEECTDPEGVIRENADWLSGRFSPA